MGPSRLGQTDSSSGSGAIGRGTFSRFRQGLLLLAEGFSFLRSHSALWPLAWVPMLFALFGVAGSATLFATHLAEIHAFWSGLLPDLQATDWWTWIWVAPGQGLFWLLGWLAVMASFAASLVGGLLIANLASAPFLDRLSQRVEAIALGLSVETAPSETSIVAEVLRSFGAELARLSFLGGLWAALSLAGFVVPGAHLLTAPALVVVTILFLPLDYAGFALDRRGLSFGSRRRWLWAELPTMLGFGGVAFVACLVPGLNLLILPSLVTAGTLLVVRARPVEDGEQRSGPTGSGRAGEMPDPPAAG